MEERRFGGKPWFSSESFTGLRAAEWQPEPKASAAPYAWRCSPTFTIFIVLVPPALP